MINVKIDMPETPRIVLKHIPGLDDISLNYEQAKDLHAKLGTALSAADRIKEAVKDAR